MDENQFNEYCKSLDVFIEYFPALETKLKDALEDREYNTFLKTF